MAQVVRKNLFGVYFCFIAKRFHCAPDSCSAKRCAAARDKKHAVCDFLLRCPTEQIFLQPLYKEKGTGLSFAAHDCFSAQCRFNCNISQLADANSRSANCLQDQSQACIPFLLRCLAKTKIFRLGQLLFLRTKNLLLQLALTRQSKQPRNARKLFNAASMEFTLRGA